ncbi:MAG TPA: solute carrier family 23 protein [Clostridiales bacterium]|nr:MAG: Uracil permease [Firmicutes bacterium ADurb.Bin262]HQK72934.1 solute carrier family 23 protein [Clostridiales bacterium]
MQKNVKTIGYLPDETPPLWKLIPYAVQQVIVMFPATVTVALITGFHVSTTIFASGLATICFILVTGRKIPLYYGSSFSYLSAIMGLMAQQAVQDQYPALDDRIAVAQFGIVMSGFVSIAAGIIVKFAGRKIIDKILPAWVTGPIAMIIGLTLAGVALGDASTFGDSTDPLTLKLVWTVSLITLVATIFFSVYLKGIWGQLPLLLGPIVGVIAAVIILKTSGVDLFRQLEGAKDTIFALPKFTLPKANWMAVAAIMPIAIATIPESTAHVYQLDIYVNDLAKKKNSSKKYDIADRLGYNLIGDGIGDIVAGFVGGPAGTNYGENISAMAITKVFSVPVLIAASIIAMLISFFTPLINAIYAIPLAVIGGLEIYLFGAIAAQGIAIMLDKKVDLFSAKNIAVIASIMVIGIGGQYKFGGSIPFFGMQVPCIAGAAVFGIVLNLLLSIGKKDKAADELTQQPVPANDSAEKV